MAEIDGLIDEYGKRDFYFVDPNFFGPGQYGQDRALRLASLLKERNIQFGIEARVNDIHEQTILNRVLIKYFTDALDQLESGKQFKPEDITALVCEAEQGINNTFPGCCGI